MKGAERGSCATIFPRHDRIHWFLSVRSICIELCRSSCRAAGCPGPWNTRETSVKQWMMDDSGKPTFDKEREVRGSDESKITGFRPAGIGKNLGSVEPGVLCDKTNQTARCSLIFKSSRQKSGVNSAKIGVSSTAQVPLLSPDCATLSHLNDGSWNLIKNHATKLLLL